MVIITVSKKLVIILLCLLVCILCKPVPAQDSISLDPVLVRGFAPSRFMAGLAVQRIDSIRMRQYAFRSLEEILSAATPLAFRSYGSGQLSTIAFRGTAASHTAVLWNGVNINLPTLGQSDFSTLPVAAFDALSVQYGAGSSSVGTDAIGGSILLGSTPAAKPGASFLLGWEEGSFNNRQMRLGSTYAAQLSKKWFFSGKTLVYNHRFHNDFPHARHKGRPLEFSNTFQKGLVQDLVFNGPHKQQLAAHVWLTDHALTLSPGQLSARELTATRSYRTLLQYTLDSWKIRTSWIRDIIDYGKGDLLSLDHSVTDRYALRLEKEYRQPLGNTLLNVLAGGEFTHFQAKVPGYVPAGVSENRADLFLLSRWRYSSRGLLSFNMRQAFITGYNPPFTPSLGAEYRLLQTLSHQLTIKGSLAKSYRVPTLNERYWKDLGNPAIRPEKSIAKELGLHQTLVLAKSLTLRNHLTLYHNKISDWIYWNPARNYAAENLQHVTAKGIELTNHWQYGYSGWKAGLEQTLGINRSYQTRAYDHYSQDILGKQLRFMPVFTGNWQAWFQYRRTRLTGQVHRESVRYTTFDHSQALPASTLIHLLLEQTFRLGTVTGTLQGRVVNLTDQLYLNVKSNAMPGRHYSLSLLFNYSILSPNN